MEQKIRELYRPDKTLIGIVGALHTLDSPEQLTVYSRLRDLNPRRIILFKNLRGQL